MSLIESKSAFYAVKSNKNRNKNKKLKKKWSLKSNPDMNLLMGRSNQSQT